jgi:photosystem II stability/assembly factor-like uncharacterized protein
MWRKLMLILSMVILVSCALPEWSSMFQSTPTVLVQPPIETSTIAPNTPVPPSPTPAPPTATPTAVFVPRPNDQIQRLVPGQELTLSTVRMFNDTDGWAVGIGTTDLHDHLFVTRDGGATWSERTPAEKIDQNDTTLRKAALTFFRSPTQAWVIYTYMMPGPNPVAFVWSTSDGGLTWRAGAELDMQGLEEIFVPGELTFSDELNGWLLVHVGAGMSHDYVALYRTTDGGANWTRIADPYTENLEQICSKTGMVFASATTGLLSGDCNGVVSNSIFFFRSADAGLTWTPVQLPLPENATDLYTNQEYMCGSYSPAFSSSQAGSILVVCNIYDPQKAKSWLYLTLDGGASWTVRYLPVINPAVQMLDASTGWLVAEQKVYRTQDGGQTWQEMGSVNWSGQPSFISAQIGWVIAKAGDAVSLVRSSDGGATWQIIPPILVP